MPANIRDEILARYKLLTETIAVIEKKLKDFPDERIDIKWQKNKAYYYKVSAGCVETYLNEKSDTDIIKQLVQKSYLSKVLVIAKKEQHELNKIMKSYPNMRIEDVYSQLPQSRKLYANPIVPCDEKYVQKWLEEPYENKNFSRDNPVYISLKGDRVRSKSELIIADRLWASGIPYKYECPLMLENVVIHPDFTVLRVSDRKIIYHEHCGMMDDPKYVEDVLTRVNLYNRCGVILGDRLFLTFETSATSFDVRVFDNIIEAHFR